MEQEPLLKDFIAAFSRLDDLSTDESLDPIAWQLATGDHNRYGLRHWEPIKVQAPPSLLEDIYSKLPSRFPPLYESLVLSYRWAEVDLVTYRLIANPPGADLNGLLQQMSKDLGLWNVLLPAGFIRFGKGPDVDYDPVCFDSGTRSGNGDCRIVKIDHEEILVRHRIRIVAELAPSFEQLVLDTIQRASYKERIG